MKLTLQDIHEMARRCAKHILEEATTADVYQKYYKDKLPQDIWDALVYGQSTITPFHTVMADRLARLFSRALNNSYSRGGSEMAGWERRELYEIAMMANKAWRHSDYTKQFLTNAAKEQHLPLTKLPLKQFLDRVSKATGQTEAQYIANGLVKVYEDDVLLVTCTTSYSASHHHYADSHWCTASDIGGEHNGFDMFNMYTSDNSILVQFVDKTDREGSYQVQVCVDADDSTNVTVERDTICDFFDRKVPFAEISRHFGNDRVKAAWNEIVKNAVKLVGDTDKNYSDEKTYYDFKNHLFVKKYIAALKEKYNSNECFQRMGKEVKEALDWAINEFGMYDFGGAEFEDVKSDSFVFDLTRIFNEADEFEYEGMKYTTVTVSPRTYYGRQDEHGDFVIDQETMNRSFFTPQEISLARRSISTPEKIERGTLIIRYVGEDRDSIQAVGFIPHNLREKEGRIVITINIHGIYIYDIVTCKQLYTNKRDIHMQPIYDLKEKVYDGKVIYIRDGRTYGEDKPIAIGKYLGPTTMFLLCYINKHTAEIKPLNKTVEKETDIGGLATYVEVSSERNAINENMSLLTEATVNDVYEKYYKDIIPEEIWNTLTNGETYITPFHTKIANILAKDIKTKLAKNDTDWILSERDITYTRCMNIARLANEAWNSSDYAKQFLTNTAKEEHYMYNIDGLRFFLQRVAKIKKMTLNNYIANGLVKVYEDNNLLVTCTTSYSASHHFFADSHWCTASDIGGEWNGFSMFYNYIDNGILVQFVNKENREKSYQVNIIDYNVRENTEPSTICNFLDKECTFDDIKNEFGDWIATEGLNAAMSKFYELFEETNKNVEQEKLYYDFKNHLFVRKNLPKVLQKINCPEYYERMKKELFEQGLPKMSENYVDTDSFDINFSYLDYEDDYSYKIDGYIYSQVLIAPRMDYNVPDGFGGYTPDEEAKARSYFTQEERGIIRRAHGINAINANYTAIVRFKDTYNAPNAEDFEVIAIVPYVGMGTYGRILLVSDDKSRYYYDIMNGKLLMTAKDGSGVNLLNYLDGKTSEDGTFVFYRKAKYADYNNLVFGKQVRKDDVRLICSIDTQTAEVRKINKKLIYNEDTGDIQIEDIKQMVRECLSLLMEATTADVYEKYYKEIIPKEIWDRMMEGTVNLTPFHRQAADTMARDFKRAKFGDAWAGRGANIQFDRVYEVAASVAEFVAGAWNSGDKIKQVMINIGNRTDFQAFKDTTALLRYLKLLAASHKFSENEFLDNALYEVYKDDTLLVTVTLSYTASRKYYGDSHWCTASDVGGTHNGLGMFKSYADTGVLVQFVDLTDRLNTYQIHINDRLEVSTICDFFDKTSTMTQIRTAFGAERVNKALDNVINNFETLYNETKKNIASEMTYYENANHLYLSKMAKGMRKKIATPEFTERVLEELNEKYAESKFCVFHEFYTDSFVFEGCDKEQFNGYYAIPFRIRSDYHFPYSDQIDTEAEERSFFTPDERAAAARAKRIKTSAFKNMAERVVIVKLVDNVFTLVKLLEETDVLSSHGRVIEAHTAYSPDTNFYDIVTGKLLFTSHTNRNPVWVHVEYAKEYYFGNVNGGPPEIDYVLTKDGELYFIDNKHVVDKDGNFIPKNKRTKLLSKCD